MATPTLADLKATADTANTKLYAAQARLDAARADVVLASAAQHQAIVASVSDQPPQAAAPASSAKARAAVAPVDPVAQAAERVAKALATWEAVRRELGVT